MEALASVAFKDNESARANKTAGSNVYTLPGEQDETPEFLRDAYTRYSRLLEHTSNWDGHGGKRLSGDTFQFALTMLAQILDDETPVRPQLVPTSYGGIQIEWHSMKGDLEIEIERPLRFSVYFEDAHSGHTEEFEGSSDFSELADILKRV